MSAEQGRKFYVDFKETGGVVHTQPTRFLPELVLTGRTKSQLDLEFERHAKMVQETLGESAKIGLRLGRAHQLARPIFLDLSLPFPGLTELKDNFYTGWFYTIEDGKIYSAFRKKDDVPLSLYLNQNRRAPYFLLDGKEAMMWNQRIKQGPLSLDRVDDLDLSPSVQAHPFFKSLAGLDIKELTDLASSIADNFWGEFKTFDRNDRSSVKREFLRNNLLSLAILGIIHRRSHRAALAEVREGMERNEITVFPLGQGTCVVRYLTDDVRNKSSIPARTIPLSHNLIRHFQRYGRLGERPMTAREFETLYRRLVNPSTKLFGKSS